MPAATAFPMPARPLAPRRAFHCPGPCSKLACSACDGLHIGPITLLSCWSSKQTGHTARPIDTRNRQQHEEEHDNDHHPQHRHRRHRSRHHRCFHGIARKCPEQEGRLLPGPSAPPPHLVPPHTLTVTTAIMATATTATAATSASRASALAAGAGTPGGSTAAWTATVTKRTNLTFPRTAAGEIRRRLPFSGMAARPQLAYDAFP
jgi:hypothetical protein